MSTISSERVSETFSAAEQEQFQNDGFIIVRGLADESLRARMLEITHDDLCRQRPPVEFEADLQYPGAPASREVPGGQTIRRLKQAISRDFVFLEWIQQQAITKRLRQLLGPNVYCPLAHHNCIMTKAPQYSSDTGWHQDIRYWSFARRELVNVWLALGQETEENGCLKLIPGTHRMNLRPEQFDDNIFFREDLPQNQELIRRSLSAELQPGDVLFFHCCTLHAASRNYTDQTKYSVVFTFHGEENDPLPGSRSASLPELLLRGESS